MAGSGEKKIGVEADIRYGMLLEKLQNTMGDDFKRRVSE